MGASTKQENVMTLPGTHIPFGKNVIHVLILHLDLPDDLAVILSLIQPPVHKQPGTRNCQTNIPKAILKSLRGLCFMP
jgi:hypothetical protein